MGTIDTIVKLIINPDDYELGMDLMWAEGLDYDEVMHLVGLALPQSGATYELKRHRGRIEMDYVRWAGAIHPEAAVAYSHRLYAFANLGY